jgi:ribosome-associated translation inhibitor RaiA
MADLSAKLQTTPVPLTILPDKLRRFRHYFSKEHVSYTNKSKYATITLKKLTKLYDVGANLKATLNKEKNRFEKAANAENQYRSAYLNSKKTHEDFFVTIAIEESVRKFNSHQNLDINKVIYNDMNQ